ncbi:MAG: thioesterase family protein [Thermomicrobiales bacterium]
MTPDRRPAPLPDSRVFVSFVRVRFHEIDALGHVNNAAYLNYLEQAAIDHANALGLDMAFLRQRGGMFVAHRHDIVFLQPALAGDVLRITTWIGEVSGARVNRHYLIERIDPDQDKATITGEIVGYRAEDARDTIVQATTEWVFVSDAGRPRRVPADVTDAFAAGSRPD